MINEHRYVFILLLTISSICCPANSFTVFEVWKKWIPSGFCRHLINCCSHIYFFNY